MCILGSVATSAEPHKAAARRYPVRAARPPSRAEPCPSAPSLTLLAVIALFTLPLRAQVETRADYLREDRTALPPAMPWQRTLEDALALSQATGKPLLICVNIDGELASEALAADRYRDPEFAALADGFVPLIASPDRHGPLDHTSRGVRLTDEKFGRVTGAEHIAVEPLVFERWFDGRRVAPRHVGVSPEGEVLFDLYLLRDLSKIDDALREHGKFDVEERPLEEFSEDELLASPDAAHREVLEASFLTGDVETRTRLALASLDATRAVQHPELLRLALHDADAGVRTAALSAIYKHPEAASYDLFRAALRLAGEEAIGPREALLPALESYAATVQEPVATSATRLAAALRAWNTGSEVIDVEPWLLGTVGRVQVEPGADESWGERLARIERRLRDDPQDPDWNLLFARNGRAFAVSLIQEGADPSLVLEDVRQAARRVVEARPDDAVARGLLAWSSYMLSDLDVALDAAREAAPGLEPWSVMPIAADVLNIVADVSLRRVYAAMEADEALPATALADAIAAHAVLLRHPLGTEAQAVRGFQMLRALQLDAPLRASVTRALERWSTSAAMHEWYRWVVLRDLGPDGMLTAYDERRLAGLDAAQRLSFSGLAKLQAAERLVDERRGAEALDAYRASISELEDAIDADSSVGDFARWYQTHARAARSRVFLAEGRLDEALAEILLGFAAEGPALDAPDGRGISPRDTLELVRDALIDAGRASDAEALDRFER